MPLLRRTHGRHREVRTVVPASCTAGLKSIEPGEHPMTRHGQVCSYDRATPAPVNGMLCARCRVATHTNPVAINATGSATWPGSRFHDMPAASMRKFATGPGTPRGTNPHRQSSAARGFMPSGPEVRVHFCGSLRCPCRARLLRAAGEPGFSPVLIRLKRRRKRRAAPPAATPPPPPRPRPASPATPFPASPACRHGRRRNRAARRRSR